MSIFGISRKDVPKLKRKRSLETLKERKGSEERQKKRKKLLEESSVLEAKARKKRAKEASSYKWPVLRDVTPKIKKKKQGRKLSQKRRIGLI